MTGSHEVRGSIPRSSTQKIKWLWELRSTVKAGFTAIRFDLFPVKVAFSFAAAFFSSSRLTWL